MKVINMKHDGSFLEVKKMHLFAHRGMKSERLDLDYLTPALLLLSLIRNVFGLV